jgi:ABC-2 type transport system permease protein
MMVNKSGQLNTEIRMGSNATYAVLMLIYLSSFITISALQHVAATDEYKAAWIFHSYPVEKPGAIIRGSFISLLCKFYLPIAVVLLITTIAWKGLVVIPNMIFGLSNQLAICCSILLINRKSFPASRPLEMKDRGGSFLRSMLMLLITGSIGVIHFMVYQFTAVILVLTILSLLANWLLLKRIGEISWKEIKELP